MKLRHLASALCLAATAGIACAEDPNLARNLAATCANCHGTDGRAVPGAGMATLAGADRNQLRQTISDFRSGAKPGTVMPQIAKGYTDEQIDLIATYYAAHRAGSAQP